MNMKANNRIISDFLEDNDVREMQTSYIDEHCEVNGFDPNEEVNNLVANRLKSQLADAIMDWEASVAEEMRLLRMQERFEGKRQEISDAADKLAEIDGAILDAETVELRDELQEAYDAQEEVVDALREELKEAKEIERAHNATMIEVDNTAVDIAIFTRFLERMGALTMPEKAAA